MVKALSLMGSVEKAKPSQIDLADLVQSQLQAEGISVEELAKNLEMSMDELSGLLLRPDEAPLYLLYSLANCLNISPESLADALLGSGKNQSANASRPR